MARRSLRLGDELLHCGDKLNKTFGDQYRTEVITGSGALSNYACDIGNDIVERLVLGFYFFANDTYVRLTLEGAFERDMAGGTSHKLDEVPILTGGVSVTLDITDYFGIGLTSRIKTEGRFDLVVLEVTVNRFGAADNLDAVVLCGIVLCEYAGVRVGVVSADDNDGLDAQFTDNLETAFELVGFFELRTTGADHIKTAGVAIFVNDAVGQFDVLMVYQAAGTHQEAVKLVGGILLFKLIVETADNVVAAGSLTTGKNDTDIHRSVFFLFVAGNELNERHTIGIGEECFNLFLVAYALGGFAFFDAHIAAKPCGKLGLVSGACNL